MSEVTIKVRDHGPLLIEGNFKLVDAVGGEFSLATDKRGVVLCRCGKSQRRPFCDGSHKTCDFQALDRAPTAVVAGSGSCETSAASERS